MTEKNFMCSILTEGVLLALLGVLMLILPRITTLTFGTMLCIMFIIYGGYKAINAYMTRNYTRHFWLNALLGLLLLSIGMFLLVAPMFNLILITSLIGIYFLTEGISTFAFGLQNRNTLSFSWLEIPVSFLQFLLGLTIILGLPSTAIWVIGVLSGINFLIAGIALIKIYIATKYSIQL